MSQILPRWREFQDAANQPKKKAMGMDAVPPHTIQWLPENVQWILYADLGAAEICTYYTCLPGSWHI